MTRTNIKHLCARTGLLLDATCSTKTLLADANCTCAYACESNQAAITVWNIESDEVEVVALT